MIGERDFKNDTHLVGKFTISNIRKDLAGIVEFEEIFELDINNILKFTAIEIGKFEYNIEKIGEI